MEEELLNLNLDADDQQQTVANRTEQRLRTLNSEKAKLAADKEELAKAKAEADTKTEAALKDADFYKNFSTGSSKYPGSAEYQDQIRERVNKGYDLEEAIVAVMAKEGKFIPASAPQAPNPSPAGGSAVINLKQGGEKTAAEMTQGERRTALMEAEKRGDLGLN